MASVIMANVTIMASVTYGNCYLWQLLLMASVNLWQRYNGKGIMAKV